MHSGDVRDRDSNIYRRKKKESFEERGTWKRLAFRVECLEMRERKGDPARHTGLVLTAMVSFSC